jgi:phosphatidylinositol 4-kinase
MWCNSSDIPRGPNQIPQPHHRIVRIPPGESVVLNSAERAPYLLLIEILHDDLDFDPEKRANKQVLKKIVTKENERQGASKDLVPFGRGKSKQQQPQTEYEDHDGVASRLPGIPPVPLILEPSPSSPTTASAFSPSELYNPDEEIDLVEQLYGPEQSLRSANLDLAESIVLPPALKNRDLDIAAWSASSPSPPGIDDSGGLHRGHMRRSQSQGGNAKIQSSTPASAVGSASGKSTPVSSLGQAQQPNGGHNVLSLDDYSQRMRTAAIMLAQLNANLVRDQVSTPMPVPSSANIPSSATLDVPVPLTSSTSRGGWIPGTSWLTSSFSTNGVASPPTADQQQQTPSAASSTQTGGNRMRLQYAEAQQIRDRIMKEMLALEEERMERMKENQYTFATTNNSGGGSGTGLGIRGVDVGGGGVSGGENSAEDEGIIRRELNKADPSAIVFSESWAAKKVCGRTAPLAFWDGKLNGWNRVSSESDKRRVALWPSWYV